MKVKKIYCYLAIVVGSFIAKGISNLPKSSSEALCMVLGGTAFGITGGTISGFILCNFVSSVDSFIVKWLTDRPEISDVACFVADGFAVFGFIILPLLIGRLCCYVDLISKWIAFWIVSLPRSSVDACYMVLGGATLGFIGGIVSEIPCCLDIISTTSNVVSGLADLPVSEELVKPFETDLYYTPEEQKQAAFLKKETPNFPVWKDWTVFGVIALGIIGVIFVNL